jgi:signal transduction histidine kinase
VASLIPCDDNLVQQDEEIEPVLASAFRRVAKADGDIAQIFPGDGRSMIAHSCLKLSLPPSEHGNVQLKCDIPADIWPVEVGIAELELALVSIAVNARDAMPGGGRSRYRRATSA